MVGSFRRRLLGAAAVLTLMLVPLAFPTTAIAGKSNLEICLDATCTSGSVHRYDFGPVVTPNFNALVYLYVYNRSSSTTITSGISGGPTFSLAIYPDGCDHASVAPGSSCSSLVDFDPLSTGRFRGTYTATGDDGSSARTGLVGTGT
jgi:hypothetical protein